MRGKIVIQSSSMALNNRPSPVSVTLSPEEKPERKSSSSAKVGEVAGETAANCVVVSCCCPCVLFEILMLAVYKVPVNICRRIWRKKKQKLITKRKNKKKGLLEAAAAAVKEGESSSVGEAHNKVYVDEVSDVDWKEFEMIKVSIDGSAVELDKKMWDRFSNTGFWRSPSQKE